MTAARAADTIQIAEPTVADVMHGEFATFPPAVTVGDVRDWFAAGASRRLALIADGDRYVGAVTPADIAADLPHEWPAAHVARYGRTVSPDMRAEDGRAEVLQTAARRVPVVDGNGRLCGVLALTTDARRFSCRDST